MNINGNLPTSEEEHAFLVYHICQGFQQLDVLEKFKDKFSKDLKTKKFETFLAKVGDDYKRYLLAAAQKYDWFNRKSPPHYDCSLPTILHLSTINWPMEQRAYVLHFQARGLYSKKILEMVNAQYRPQRTQGGLNLELTYLNSKPDLVKALQSESHKFDWWEPEPVKGDKKWKAMDRRTRRVMAYERKKAFEDSFKEFEEGASKAATREETEEDLFGDEDEDEGEFSFLSSSPTQTSSTMPSSSSRNPQSSKQTYRNLAPAPLLLSSHPAGAFTTPDTASASYALAYPNTAGASSDNDHDEDTNNEEDDDFSKPFYSPDASSPSFPNDNPTSRRLPRKQLNYGSPLHSSSPLSLPTRGIPEASRTTSSPTYLTPPVNAPSYSAPGPSQSSSTMEGRPIGVVPSSISYLQGLPTPSSMNYPPGVPPPPPPSSAGRSSSESHPRYPLQDHKTLYSSPEPFHPTSLYSKHQEKRPEK